MPFPRRAQQQPKADVQQPKSPVKRHSVFEEMPSGDVASEDCWNIMLEKVKEQEVEEMDELASNTPGHKPLLALLAEDNMRQLLHTFVECHADMLSEFRLTGPSATCEILRKFGLKVEDTTIPNAALGGTVVVGGMIADGSIKGVFYFRDPLSSSCDAADTLALQRLADCYQIYFATNYRSAAAVLTNLHKKLNAAKTELWFGNHRQRHSVIVPEHLQNLGEVVMKTYKPSDPSTAASATSTGTTHSADRFDHLHRSI